MDTITSYNFEPGQVIAKKYEVVSQIESGEDGELYMLNECSTGIERTAKFFFPHCNPRNRVSTFYARKLHRLRHCKALIQYRTQETIKYDGLPVTFLVSDFVDGEYLPDYIHSQPGRRLKYFSALHLMHALATGLEPIHAAGECHGGVYEENIIIVRRGLGFQIKLIDLFHTTGTKPELIKDDVYNIFEVIFDAMGADKRYVEKFPAELRQLFKGMRREQITGRFKNAGILKRYLETLVWE